MTEPISPAEDLPGVIEVTVSSYVDAREAFRCKDLRQALYDEGDVVMSDVLVNLHGAEHRARRRLENRLFRKDTHRSYEREFFPPVVTATLAPHIRSGGAEVLVDDVELPARPSDALAIALRAGVPILCAEGVLAAVGFDPEADAAPPEQVVEAFREFLDSVNPDDFEDGEP